MRCGKCFASIGSGRLCFWCDEVEEKRHEIPPETSQSEVARKRAKTVAFS